MIRRLNLFCSVGGWEITSEVLHSGNLQSFFSFFLHGLFSLPKKKQNVAMHDCELCSTQQVQQTKSLHVMHVMDQKEWPPIIIIIIVILCWFFLLQPQQQTWYYCMVIAICHEPTTLPQLLHKKREEKRKCQQDLFIQKAQLQCTSWASSSSSSSHPICSTLFFLVGSPTNPNDSNGHS